MTVTALVTINVDIDELDRFEAAHPEVTKRLSDGGFKYGLTHRRVSKPGTVVEIEGFPSMENLKTFLEESRGALEEYERLLGVPCLLDIYEDVEFEG